MRLYINIFIFIFTTSLFSQTVLTDTANLKKWHTITIEFTAGESYSETGSPNPFLDRRLNVTFTAPSTATYVVPGYFAADGDAAETSATSGTKWHVKFSPDETGEWSYTASFRAGTDVAVTYPSSASDGSAHTSIDGDNGTFTIGATDKTGKDFRGKGRLQVDDTRYPKFAETGEIFFKAGPDSPENFLGYQEFDDQAVYGATDNTKDYADHVAEWQSGDPQWQTNQGRGIIGALNYLADSLNNNSVSFLTMNKRRGDSKDVTMHVDPSGQPITDYTVFDVSRTAQWEIVFEHAQTKGIFLHFKTQEQENADQLDENDAGKTAGQGGYLGTERKLYYRELIARFGHHLALNWNMGEENEGSDALGDNVYDAERRDQVTYVKSIDPYNHLRVVHSGGSFALQDAMYDSLLLAPISDMTGVSLQTSRATINERVEHWITESGVAGINWPVSSDETATGATDDQTFREDNVWGAYLAGGWGIEIYKPGDFSTDDYKEVPFPAALTYAGYGAEFMETIPAGDMTADNDFLSGLQNMGFSEVDSVYVGYFEDPTGETINIGNSGDTFDIEWYDPRNGGARQSGSTATLVANNTSQSFGTAPSATTSDWVVVATNQNYSGTSSIAVTGVSVAPASASIAIGGTTQLTETVTPGTATDQTGTWSSNATGVATVNSSGLVTGVATGSATITFTTTDGSFTDTSAITVIQAIANKKFNRLGGTNSVRSYIGSIKIPNN